MSSMYDRLLLPKKQTLRSYHQTIKRIETNLKDLTDMVEESEPQARSRAVAHLDLLGRERG